MSDGEKILQLLQSFDDGEHLVDNVQALYDTAYQQRMMNPAETIEACQKGLTLLDRSFVTAYEYQDQFTYSRGQFHLLLASVYLDQNKKEAWVQAEKHYRQSEEEFHQSAWAYLDSLACLGLALAKQKLKDLPGMVDASHQADIFAKYESIPSTINLDPLRQAIAEANSTLMTLLPANDISPPPTTWRIPIVSQIAAGLGPSIAPEHILGHVSITERDGKFADYFAIVTDGDSMTGDKIMPGDKVLIRRQEYAENRDIAAIVVNRSEKPPLGFLKRYHLYDETDRRHWFLRSSNTTAPNLVVIPPDTDVAAIRQIYDKELQANQVTVYENAELKIAGVYVKVIDES